MNEFLYPIHKPGRTSMIILAVLLAMLCITIPFSIYILIRLGSMRVRVTPTGLEAKGLMTDEVVFEDVERFGLVEVPLVARGLGAVVANMKLNNLSKGINLVFILKNGKTVKFIANQFERHDELIAQVTGFVKAPREHLTMGLLGIKWPEKQ